MNKTTVPIKGIHCRSCEILIHDELAKIKSVKKVIVNHQKNQAAIFYTSSKLKDHEIAVAVKAAGYEIGESNDKPIISKNLDDYTLLAKCLAIVVVLYFVFRNTGLGGLSFSPSSGSLPIVFLIGLTAGVSTCMALVGGLVLGASARYAEAHPKASRSEKFRPHLFFNLGRVIGFSLFGGIIGLAGRAFQLSGVTLGLLTIVVGLVMLILGLQLTEIFPRLSSGGVALPSGLAKIFGLNVQKEKEYSHKNAIILGALTFFLPCGFTQAMQLYAISTGHFLSGALVMGIFALGTVPGLLSIGGLTSIAKGAFSKKIFKFAGVVVIFLALFNITNGYHLTGWPVYTIDFSGSSSDSSPTVSVQDGMQVINMAQTASGYSPNKFTIKKGIPVKWVIDSQGAGCASSIVASSINIHQSLNSGQNIIEFTPNQVGTINFSCSMGMYRGAFNVVEN